MPLKPELSRTARRQLARLAKSSPERLNRVLEVMTDVAVEPFEGLHKPESLRGDLSGYWSVRLNRKDRLVYRVDGEKLIVESVEGHYEDH